MGNVSAWQIIGSICPNPVRVTQSAVYVRISTYANWSMRPFQSLYFTGGDHGQVYVRLNQNRFEALGEAWL